MAEVGDYCAGGDAGAEGGVGPEGLDGLEGVCGLWETGTLEEGVDDLRNMLLELGGGSAGLV